jgi:hypothetical protein
MLRSFFLILKKYHKAKKMLQQVIGYTKLAQHYGLIEFINIKGRVLLDFVNSYLRFEIFLVLCVYGSASLNLLIPENNYASRN